MTIREMHYDFKSKLNKIDSQQYRNLLVPEIDWKLNEAQLIYIRSIVQPRYRQSIEKQLGFELNQRTIDDMRGIVVEQYQGVNCSTTITKKTPSSAKIQQYTVALPNDYMFFVRGYATCTKTSTGCTGFIRVYEQQKSDLHEENSLDKSSFEWEEINIEVTNSDILLYTDNTFTFTELCLTYIKIPIFIQNAQDYIGGEYYKPDGVTLLTGFVNCQLPSYTHSEIVDLAVLITAGDIQMSDYQLKLNKIKLTE